MEERRVAHYRKRNRLELVLDHVKDLELAFAEVVRRLYRVLSSGGRSPSSTGSCPDNDGYGA